MAEDTLDVDKIEELHSLNEVGECLYPKQVHKHLACLIAEVRRLREKYEPNLLRHWNVEKFYKGDVGSYTYHLPVGQLEHIDATLDSHGRNLNGKQIDHIVLTPVYE